MMTKSSYDELLSHNMSYFKEDEEKLKKDLEMLSMKRKRDEKYVERMRRFGEKIVAAAGGKEIEINEMSTSARS